MTGHTYHPDSHTHGLADNCPRCQEHAKHPERSLDRENIRRLLRGETHTETDRVAEARLKEQLLVGRFLEAVMIDEPPEAPDQLSLCFEHKVEFWRRIALSPLEVNLLVRLVAPGENCEVCNGSIVRLEDLRTRAQRRAGAGAGGSPWPVCGACGEPITDPATDGAVGFIRVGEDWYHVAHAPQPYPPGTRPEPDEDVEAWHEAEGDAAEAEADRLTSDPDYMGRGR